MSGRLCVEVAQLFEHLDSYRFFVCNFFSLDCLVEIRVRVFSVHLEVQVKCLVINSRARILYFLVLRSDPFRKHLSRSLNAVAQSCNVHIRHGL